MFRHKTSVQTESFSQLLFCLLLLWNLFWNWTYKIRVILYLLLDFLWTKMNFKLVKTVTNKTEIFYKFTKNQILNLKNKKWCRPNQELCMSSGGSRLKCCNAETERASWARPMGKFSLLSVPTFLQSGAPGGLAWLLSETEDKTKEQIYEKKVIIHILCPEMWQFWVL
jgi:hypothetical protein